MVCLRTHLLILIAFTPVMFGAENRGAIEFHRDIIPVLTKAGCNSGRCHGAFQGRGGFRLSLLGFDPQIDFEALTKERRGRRVSPAAPDQSLLLLKATATVPHGGGKRFDIGSEEHQLLRQFIAQGLPVTNPSAAKIIELRVEPNHVTLKVASTATLRALAVWTDGTERDVTRWSLFDSANEQLATVSTDGHIVAERSGKTAVMVRYLGQSTIASIAIPYDQESPPVSIARTNFIDDAVISDWQRMGVNPAGLASDSDFVRRVHLDLIGTLPTVDEVTAFLDSTEGDKRRQLIDRLLERPEYVDYWALKWGDLLRAHRRYLGDRGLESFSAWLRQSVRANRPLNEVARELLTAQGNVFTTGPVAFYFVDEKPEELAETTAQVFLGVRLQCARCHHHPFETWSQDDYRGLAAFFTRLEIKNLDQSGRFGGARILRVSDQPSAARRIAGDPLPRVLDTSTRSATTGGEMISGDPRATLAAWVIAPDNAYFARNFVNRYWKHLFGRGIVEPVDDVRSSNPPSNAELLDGLARDFIQHQFDVKHLLRVICNSAVYQRGTELSPMRDQDGSLFTHRVPRRLASEVLLDAVNQVTGTTESFAGMPPATRAIALPDPTIVSSFLATFGRPDRSNPCECARPVNPDLSQTLLLINNTDLNGKLTSPTGRISKLLADKRSDAQIADEIYLAALSRRPTVEEHATIAELIAAGPSRREAWEDVLWSLLNSAEFVFGH